MLGIAIVVGAVIGAFAWLKQSESKPVPCPSCGARTLIADRNGHYWRCVPCQAQYFWLGSELHRYSGTRSVPSATLRRGGDRDKVRE